MLGQGVIAADCNAREFGDYRLGLRGMQDAVSRGDLENRQGQTP